MNPTQLAKPTRAIVTLGILVNVFPNFSLPHFTVDEVNGQVVFEGATYTFADDHLRLIGTCSRCGKDVPSKPILRKRDAISLIENFVPEEHDCMDV
jgi:hypothetical protein